MKGLSSAGFSIAQPTLMRRAPKAKRAPAAAANFCYNYQKSNKNHFFKNVLKMHFFLTILSNIFLGDIPKPPLPPPPSKCRPFRHVDVLNLLGDTETPQ